MASASSSPPSSAAASAVLGSLDLVIAITSNLTCRDLRAVTAAVSITDDSVEPLPPPCNMCTSGRGCRKDGACERPLRLDGLRGRMNAQLSAQQVSIGSLLRVLCTETVCDKCDVQVCECSKENCGCGDIGCGKHDFVECASCQRTFCGFEQCNGGCISDCSICSSAIGGPDTNCHMCRPNRACANVLFCYQYCCLPHSGRVCTSCEDRVLCRWCADNYDPESTAPPSCSVCGKWSCCEPGCAPFSSKCHHCDDDFCALSASSRTGRSTMRRQRQRRRRRRRRVSSSRTAEAEEREQKDRDPKRLLTAMQRDLCLLLKDKTKPNNTFAKSRSALHGIKLHLISTVCCVSFLSLSLSFSSTPASTHVSLSSLPSSSPQQSKENGVRFLFASVVWGGVGRARQPRSDDRHHVEPLVHRHAQRHRSRVDCRRACRRCRGCATCACRATRIAAAKRERASGRCALTACAAA
jgi:hypothetical protein